MNTQDTAPWYGWPSLRQLAYPGAFRIGAVSVRPQLETQLDITQHREVTSAPGATANLESQPGPATGVADAAQTTPDDAVLDKVFADLANALWYLKSKFIRHPWDEAPGSATEPRARRALRQIDRATIALTKVGVSVDDPINRRFPHGSEAMMQPLDYQPRADLHEDTVIETAAPMVFRDDRLVRRGEVFVGVPQDTASDAG